ncbi:hypothetical protein C8J57DRAFT_1076826 [Mycena rebaudengoi]|nr:hypothetical protein C8J57DRAFT_1076826 [Mycena rebaudengoi]
MDLGGKYATALQAASVSENTGGDILKLLLEGGADPIALGLRQIWTALQTAAHIWDVGKVQVLLEYKADPNTVGGEYGTALKAAVHNAHSDIVALPLSNDTDPNIQGKLNICALRPFLSLV